MGTAGQVRWWGHPAWQVWPARAIVWFTVAMSVPFLLNGPPAIAVAIFFLPLAWFGSRTSAVAIGLDGEPVYLRRLFLGRVERLPFSDIRRCLVLRGLLTTRLRLRGPWRLWLTMEQAPFMLGGAVRDWDGLLDALREVFEPLGRWEDVRVWW